MGGLLRDMIDSLGASIPCIDPRQYGAVGDGVTDDKAAMLLAITAGIAADMPVGGYGRTYGIAGNMTLVEDAWLQDISFKQLTPAAGTVRTLTSAGGSNIKLIRVTVDRNGTGTAGVLGVDSGIWIEGGTGHYFEDVEVYGDDIGSGLLVKDASDFDVFRARVHDIHYISPGAVNDCVSAIWMVDCNWFRLIQCQAEELSGDFGGGLTRRWTRGFQYSGCSDFQVLGCRVRDVDQGNDITGGTGNARFLFDSCFAVDCMTVSFKFANTARDGQVNNCVAVRAGLWPFVASGPTGAGMTAVATRNITFSNCKAYDTGGWAGPGVPVAGGKIAFRVMNGSHDVDSTVGIRFIACEATDRQSSRTMSNGFANDVAAPTTGEYNEVIDCVSIGNLGVAFSGMNESRCDVKLLAAQAIPSHASNWEAINWTSDEDFGNMHDNVTTNYNITIRRDGVYRFSVGALFAANATGQRGLRLVREGGVLAGSTVLLNAAGAGETALQASKTFTAYRGDNLRAEVFNNSGSPVDLQATSEGIVEQVG